MQGVASDAPFLLESLHVAVGLSHVVFDELDGFPADFLGLPLVGLAHRLPNTHLLELPETSKDVGGDVGTLGSAVHPRPAAIVFLFLFE